MATVIDSLIVTLGLDPTNFTKGQKEAGQAFIKTKTEVAKGGKEVEDVAKKMLEGLSGLRSQALLLFATFTGGRSIKQFVNDMTASNSAIGRAAYIMGTTVGKVSQLRGMVAAFGGSADGAVSSINNFNQELVKLSLTGESSVLPYLRALQAAAPQANLSLVKANGQLRTAIDMLPDLHKAVQGMDAARATAILSGLGLSQDIINVLIQSDEAFNKFMSDQARWGNVTKEQAAAAQRLQYSTHGVFQSFETLGRILLTQVEPYIERVNKRLTDLFIWFQAHPREMAAAFSAITAAVVALGLVFGGPIAWVAALAGAVAFLFNDWMDWNEKGTSTFGVFWQAVSDGWKQIEAVAIRVWNSISGTVLPIYNTLKTAFLDYVNVLKSAFRLVYSLFFGTSDQIRAAWSALMGDLKKYVHDFVAAFATTLNETAKAVILWAPKLYEAVKKAFGQAFGWAVDRANTVWRAITGHNLIDDNSQREKAATEGAERAAGGAVSGGLTAVASRERFNKAVAFFMSKGWTENQAIGIAANFNRESGFNEKAVGDNGAAFGLAQWHADRQAKFRELFNKDIRKSTYEEQLEFADWELRHGEWIAGERLRHAKTKGESAAVVSKFYERPADREGEAARRARDAEAFSYEPLRGARIASVLRTNDNRSTRTSTSTTSIGTINVNAPNATDAYGVSREVGDALDARFNALMANQGQN